MDKPCLIYARRAVKQCRWRPKVRWSRRLIFPNYRLKRLSENLTRTGLDKHVQTVCADLSKWNPETQADVIVLDAPCSATGTIRRHPDLPYNRTLKDLKSLTSLQYDLLNRAKKWVKTGGTLVYCTCSTKSEGEHQVDRFLNQNRNFKRAAIANYKQWQTADGDIRLLPSYGHMDGFFIAVLERQEWFAFSRRRIILDLMTIGKSFNAIFVQGIFDEIPALHACPAGCCLF